MAMKCFAFLLILVLGAPAIYADDHTVGGTQGWTTGYDYATWAAGETFKIGDNLLFNYASNHQVDVVTESDYTNCVSNPIKNYKGGKTTIPLTVVGPIYFICPISNHCTQGMKLKINVTLVTTVPPPSGETPSGSPPPPTSGKTVSPPPPSTTTPSNGVEGSFGILSKLVLGLSLVMMGLMGQ